MSRAFQLDAFQNNAFQIRADYLWNDINVGSYIDWVNNANAVIQWTNSYGNIIEWRAVTAWETINTNADFPAGPV